MFDNLSDKLQSTLGELRQRGSLTEQDLDAAMREIRLALLEADVNFKVVRTFVAAVRERAVGGDVLKSLTPGQQVVKIVDEELTELLGGTSATLTFAAKPPTVILLCGLQGSGKTTFAGKLARRLQAQGRSPALVACDVYRPAAIDQLRTLGEQVGVPVFERGTDADPVEIARWGVESATQQGRDVILVDTAGRLHVDRELMDELVKISKKVSPQHTLLVLDSMTGQEAVAVAEQFQEAVDFDGVVLTKLDGDARGGAALSVRAVTGRPILFVGVGEKLDALEEFHPDRMASRILGMGDMLSLIERAEGQLDKEQSEELERKIRKNEFTLDDLSAQIKQIRKMGSMRSILGMLPGHRQAGARGPDRREPARPRGGDHQLDDAEGAPRARRDRRLAPQAHRSRLRHERAAGQPGAPAVPADAEIDEAVRHGRRPGHAERHGRPAHRARAARALARNTRGGEKYMAMKIRLTRRGSKKNPIYRVVVADVRAPRDGRSIATIGRYDPKPNPSFIEIDTDAAREWIAKGALPTNTVAKLLKIAGV